MSSRKPMQRSELVAALKLRRDNDVYVRVPLETGGYIRKAAHEVIYNPEDDTIEIVTDEYLDGPDDSDDDLPPFPTHVTLIDDGSGDPPAVVHGDAPLSPEGEAAMRNVIAAAKRLHVDRLAADPSIGERQEAAIARIRERRERLHGGGAG
jgi:hypothetical protein